ncbi:tRNA 5-methoxyuridine(34)/uridine 5-oxyacetic acid(34) synthase CmoB [Cronobacter dublinensis subsp. dublinensis]|uniref:tRNA 5-methoxyuridine(34)/uridine 5-oxyacetic acid(34) synthase CmoB n=1 Tax=Cronobacter dublinensis TaxID=413497 RepID=UPI000CFDDF43|nr:tRNA 5-methoxyuridine(34)/uridine 5-oxyacetic acid(34) synthase CmoB [Cronobacter dublinensis]EGT5660121.1 tRNA 5-methoxyuridine(34)/uridine 5-oxyacetic acid(34) synthase CmoB [Cronobacter dublinensis subsp. dublinensis]EGT5667582.1 tRNA 5-methoxyuridine(34)/uridine 5-oxyacetic acid(34) synthase CmoB [Cronobacter dublinensis subsp. dublinensis]EGT5672087.1 tRNA 5-methoxyuridine(34)/uridine 5-oxyacetic acid(34) synthase CmoB [Cronobacter dublinensis subsp. dublinensis]EGT5676009.1 tRNA 5-meth
MIDFGKFYQQIACGPLAHWLETLPAQVAAWQRDALHGQFKQWKNSLDNLPALVPDRLDLLHSVSAQSDTPLSDGQRKRIEQLLRTLMPWRKGPFSLYGIDIDTEWRSDLKWDRVLPHITPLAGRTILDVGCGSGYHLWRMVGAGAQLAVGIDPTQLFLCQFEAVRKLLGGDNRAHVLPLGIEQMPALNAFDTVFSMGVLYHRRSPLEHLWQLKDQLVNEGELVLETLVVEGDENTVLVPGERYAQMRNVYFIPSAPALKNWLEKCGFVDVRIADYAVTTVEEQRRTAWMQTESLADFLDPQDATKTREGYPAPLRAVLVARKP